MEGDAVQYNLEGKTFTSASNTGSGEVGNDTRFRYHQEGRIVWADYAGGAIVKGHLISPGDRRRQVGHAVSPCEYGWRNHAPHLPLNARKV